MVAAAGLSSRPTGLAGGTKRPVFGPACEVRARMVRGTDERNDTPRARGEAGTMKALSPILSTRSVVRAAPLVFFTDAHRTDSVCGRYKSQTHCIYSGGVDLG